MAGCIFTVTQGDITRIEADAIVNAANSSLLGGGGVDGAIHRAAGPGLLAECRTLNGCKTGQAKATAGHNLKARHVIHTVGPVWNGGKNGEPDLLAACFRNSLHLASSLDLRSIAFPAISCGVYRFPVPLAAQIAAETFLNESPKTNLHEIMMVLFDQATQKIFQEAFAKTGLTP